MSRRYELILFDCFNTLFSPVESRVPTVIVDGKPTPSTAGVLREVLPPREPELTAEQVHRAHRDAWRWAETQRGEECREVPALSRFRHMLESLELPDPGDSGLERILATHIAAVTACYELPAAHRALLERLRPEYRLAMLSNFDYGPGVRNLLNQHSIAGWFNPVVISAELGFRKPGRRAFQRTLALAGIAAEATLFVGDSLADDVAGARAVGLDVAWLNPNGGEAPAENGPTYTIERLEQIETLLS